MTGVPADALRSRLGETASTEGGYRPGMALISPLPGIEERLA